ncbi:hypothetical protein FRC04_008895 [Tulasnella sp. 424]|nr:hypothetical protein FRC04_008895 [Tulasnella sp. 424]KAG8973795.1 hypothetical protein FRC05_008214 [Tulasnella sp. 425]
MSETAALQKQLKIKTGVVERLIKEVAVYRKEEENERKRVDKLVAEGAEGADLRNAEKILQEAQKMVPDAETRMKAAVHALRDVINSAKDSSPPLPDDDETLLKAEEASKKSGI